MSDLKQQFENGSFTFGLDADNDGAMSIKGKLSLNEAISEAFKRGEKVEGAKVVSVGFEGMSLKIVIDTDKDGESLLELEIAMPEAFDEATKRF